MLILTDHSSVAEGETALLACAGQGSPSVEISWWHSGQTIRNSTVISIIEEDVPQGERLLKQSFLQICSVEMADAGEYTCIVSNGQIASNSSTQLTVTAGMQ